MSSNSFGPALAPLFVVAIMASWGWHMVFISLFMPGLFMCWLIWKYIPDHPRESQSITSEELAEIEGTDDLGKDERRLSDQCQEKVRSLEKVKLHQGAVVQEIGKKEKQSFWQILAIPAVWQTFLCFFFFDITLWGFLSWLPTYLVKARGFDLTHMGLSYTDASIFAQAQPKSLTGYTDASVYRPRTGIPLIVCGPGRMEMAHQRDEYVELPMVHEAVQIYTKVVEKYLIEA